MSEINFEKKKRKKKKRKTKKVDLVKIEAEAFKHFEPYITRKKIKRLRSIKITKSGKIEEEIRLNIESILKYEKVEKHTPRKVELYDGTKDIIKYEYLLNRLYNMIGDVITKKKIKIVPPRLAREPRKTVILNFNVICESLNRPQKHLKVYILIELRTTGSICMNKERLVIRGIFYQNDIQNLIITYVKRFIKCNTCQGFNTKINRDVKTRLYNLCCYECKASQSVINIFKK